MSVERTEFEERFDFINDLRLEAINYEGAARVKSDEAESETKELIALVREGKLSSGRHLVDFALVTYRSTGLSIVSALMDLEDKFAENIGEVALVVVCHDTGDSMSPISERVMLGIIDDGMFRVKPRGESCVFPFSALAIKEGNVSDSARLTDEPLQIGIIEHGYVDIRQLNVPLETGATRMNNGTGHEGSPYLKLEIHVGDEAVLGWFIDKGKRYDDIYLALCNELNVHVPFSKEVAAS